MSGTTSIPESGAWTNESAAGEGQQALGWRRLQIVAALVTIASLVAPMIIEGTVAGFLIVMAAPFVVGVVLARFLPRVAAIFLGVIATATLVFSAPFTFPALTHLESATDFVPQVFHVLSLAIAAVAAVPAFREIRRGEDASSVPRAILGGAAAVAVVATAVSIVVAAGVDSVAAQPGDEPVITRDFAFAPAKLSAKAGTVAVHLTNEDSTRHTFTIDGVTDVSVAPNSSQRVTFEAEPGTYRFYCIPHSSDMDGVLTVE